MTFANRLTRCPTPFDSDRGAEIAALYADQPAEFRALVAGAAGSSSFLADLLRRDSDWLKSVLEAPEEGIGSVIRGLSDLPFDSLGPDLRRAKRKVALLTALADLGGVWSLETVTQALSDFADAAVDTCLKQLCAAFIRRGKLPGFSPEDAETACGMVALAMGKMGAGELNYSSDIDLIVLFDQTRLNEETYDVARMSFVRITRQMTQLLSDATAEGYVFRTDLRLRPDASVTPVCLSMSAAESYYEGVGRTWERAAYIKARPAAGDIEAGVRFLEGLRPFIWRKHLDFVAIQDAHDMRLRIRDHKGLHGPLKLDGHNIKLGRGGIREIEFFTQTRQLIAGGRDPKLRVRSTRAGLDRLAQTGWIEQQTATKLYDHYRYHREIEHRLQMIADQQTQTLPSTEQGWAQLAAFCGVTSAALKTEITERIEEVHTLIEEFFVPEPAKPATEDFGRDVTDQWLNYPALRSARALEIFTRLKPEIIGALREAAQPEEALRNFDRFLSGLPAGVQLFSLFEANPKLTRLVVDVCATAPALSSYLAQNADVFDMVIGGDFFAPWPDLDSLVKGLSRAMSVGKDYEDKLNMARRWMKEWHFRIGVHLLRRITTPRESGYQYSDLAEAVVRGLWPVVVEEFSRKHGPQPGRGAVVLGMGSLGARQLNAGSDLDLIVIYDAQGADSSDGPRPLATRPYFARLTQALVTAVTVPMSDGRLYEVDMRLRPSGRQGPVATSIDAFTTYQRTEAWTWEHLALSRARVIAGDVGLGGEVENFRKTLLAEKSNSSKVIMDVAEMHARIREAKQNRGAWDAKIGPGRLQEVELCAQSMALLSGCSDRDTESQLAAGVAAGFATKAQARSLLKAAEVFWTLQAAGRLLTGEALDPDLLGEAGRRFVLTQMASSDIASLEITQMEVAEEAAKVIDQLFTYPQGDTA